MEKLIIIAGNKNYVVEVDKIGEMVGESGGINSICIDLFPYAYDDLTKVKFKFDMYKKIILECDDIGLILKNVYWGIIGFRIQFEFDSFKEFNPITRKINAILGENDD